MTMLRGVAFLIIVGVLLSISVTARGQSSHYEDNVTLYLPAFEGPGDIGLNVATVLNLQIWQTLRKTDGKNHFIGGLVVWNKHPFESASFDAVDEVARVGFERRNGQWVYPQLILWGKARPFWEGVVVEAYLAIPPSYTSKFRDGWDVTVQHDGQPFRIHADFPQRRYDFAPIVLKKELVETYSMPTALHMYASRDRTRPIGNLGSEYEAKDHVGDWVYLQSEGRLGWVPLPRLSDSRSEIVDFVAGVIRIFRGDWDGADTFFQQVLASKGAPTTLKTDALLYQVMARTKAGRDARHALAKAKELAPFYSAAIIYSVMTKLEALSQTSSKSAKLTKAIVSDIGQELDENHALFLPNDPWLSSVRSFLHAYHSYTPVATLK